MRSTDVEVVAVGDELLVGDTVNGNAATLGRLLTEAGLTVTRSSVVGDDVATIAAEVLAAAGRVPTVVVTGGLGPTQDDLTREGLALAAGVGLERDPVLARAVADRYAAAGRPMPPMALRMADRPAGATVLANPRGSAPGIRLPLGASVVLALPGVPHEMLAMAAQSVVPDVAARAGARPAFADRLLRTSGVWESHVAEALTPLVEQGAVAVGFYASRGEVRVRLRARGDDPLEVAARLDRAAADARAALGAAVHDGETLAAAVADALAAAGQTVATAESLTGGMVGAALTDRGGASAVYRGGVVAYATDLKASLLGVPQELLATRGAVDAEVAAAMAEGVRARLGATWGLATTGVAGPDPQDGQPPGTVYVGLAGPGGCSAVRRVLPGDRDVVRTLAVVVALDALRRALAGSAVDGTVLSR